MKNQMKKSHTPQNSSSSELCQAYGVVSSQIFKWKKALIEQGAEVFKNSTPSQSAESAEIE